MWGEIEPRSKPASTLLYETLSVHTEDEEQMDEDEEAGESASDAVCSQTSDLTQQVEGADALTVMMQAIATSGTPVKSQQLGEPDLTVEEKKVALMEQYKSKPLVFLERYHTHLKPEHLEVFSHLSSDCRAQYYCSEVQKRASASSRTRVRNHRYAALRALQKEGQYFSEEQMRFREPLLYEQYIGQYLSEEEILQRSQEAMCNGPQGLSDLLINTYHEKQLQDRLEEEQSREDCAEEEEEEEDEEDDGNGRSTQAEWQPTAEEKERLREEFLSRMHQSFLEGKDKDFNYSEVDENPEYDNLDIVSRDAEDRYFDDDDNDEEEEEEEEEDDGGDDDDKEEKQ